MPGTLEKVQFLVVWRRKRCTLKLKSSVIPVIQTILLSGRYGYEL